MNYFSKVKLTSENNTFMNVTGLFSLSKPLVGDVLKVYFSKKGSYFFFEGFCFNVSFKNFKLPDTGIKLINKIKGSIICFTFSFFYNLIFSFEKINYKKSKTRFRRAKVTKFKNINI